MSRQGFTAFYLDLNLTGGFSLFFVMNVVSTLIKVLVIFSGFFGKISRFGL